MYASDHLQRFVRSRAVRLGLVVTLIAVAGWAFLPLVTSRISSSAFVNAKLLRVAAPIAGRLTSDLPHKGEFIGKPITVTLIDVLMPDRRRIIHFDSQYTVAKGRADLARKQLAAIAVADAEFAKRMQIFRDGMIERLGHARDEAEAEKTGCLAEAGQRRDVGSQMQQLVKAGTASPMRTAEALALLGSTSTRCDMADARLRRLQSELTSAKEGVFLGDGANDAPYSQQQRDRLLLRQQELETTALEESLLASQAAAEAAEERKYFERLSHFDLTLPANYVVWSVPASPGTTVSESQILLDLADCEHRFVEVELPERDFERIKHGAPAFIRLIGSSEWTQGQILQARGSAASPDDRLIAARVQRPDQNLKSITVEVDLPSDDSQTSRENFCNIGRLAEVRFQRSGFTFVSGWSGTLQKLVGYFKHRAADDQAASN
jgi:multidrug resistance efflux pump